MPKQKTHLQISPALTISILGFVVLSLVIFGSTRAKVIPDNAVTVSGATFDPQQECDETKIGPVEYKMKNNMVKEIQKCLLALRFRLKITGKYDRATAKAVKSFLSKYLQKIENGKKIDADAISGILELRSGWRAALELENKNLQESIDATQMQQAAGTLANMEEWRENMDDWIIDIRSKAELLKQFDPAIEQEFAEYEAKIANGIKQFDVVAKKAEEAKQAGNALEVYINSVYAERVYQETKTQYDGINDNVSNIFGDAIKKVKQ